MRDIDCTTLAKKTTMVDIWSVMVGRNSYLIAYPSHVPITSYENNLLFELCRSCLQFLKVVLVLFTVRRDDLEANLFLIR